MHLRVQRNDSKIYELKILTDLQQKKSLEIQTFWSKFLFDVVSF